MFVYNANAQDVTDNTDTSFFYTPELLFGKTLPANEFFPETSLQKSFFVNFGKYNYSPEKEWAKRLGFPKTGISIGIIDFGNSELVGRAYSFMPFMEFGMFKKKTNRWNILVGAGGSYMDTQYDLFTNITNEGITTKINWSFRTFVYYDFYKTERISWRFGLGLLHHSNGHTRLPNQGLNSILASASATIDSKNRIPVKTKGLDIYLPNRSMQTYFAIRTGIGQNVLSEQFNKKKEVYSFAISAGKIIGKTFKLGIGFYYRFYENYYDHIKNEGPLINELYPYFKDDPNNYATNYGVFLSTELLLNHFGFEFELGFNFHKPFYKLDWQLNEGESFILFLENNEVEYILRPGELTSKYKIKKLVSTRIGLKYYIFSTNDAPKNNFYFAAHINANLGQADFTEFSVGYVYQINFKNK